MIPKSDDLNQITEARASAPAYFSPYNYTGLVVTYYSAMVILNFLFDANGNTDWFFVIIAIVVLIIIFFVSRGINLWYWKINDSIKNQEEQIKLLKKIAGETKDNSDPS